MSESLNLNEFLPQAVDITIGEDVVTVSSDLSPILLARANTWLGDWGRLILDPTIENSASIITEGWNIGEAIVGRDLHSIGTAGLVAVLTFFRDHYSAQMQKVYSRSLSRFAESSTEESPSENSSEAPNS